jgi:hypothetical protein
MQQTIKLCGLTLLYFDKRIGQQKNIRKTRPFVNVLVFLMSAESFYTFLTTKKSAPYRMRLFVYLVTFSSTLSLSLVTVFGSLSSKDNPSRSPTVNLLLPTNPSSNSLTSIPEDALRVS